MAELRVTQIEYDVIAALAAAGGNAELPDLQERTGIDQSKIHAGALALAERGFVAIAEREQEWLALGKAGLAQAGRPLPERTVLLILAAAGVPLDIQDIPQRGALTAAEVGSCLRFLEAKGWAKREGRRLVLSDAGQAAADTELDDERLLGMLTSGPRLQADLAALPDLDLAKALEWLRPRRDFIEIRRRKVRQLTLTPTGRQALDQGLAPRRAVTALTRDLLLDGQWRDVELKPYNVADDAAAIHPGKAHPLQRVFEQARRIFLELGFHEVASPHVESAFWDFDALFQPQDHPARDMQDTFYLAAPGSCALPADSYVDAVCRTHESGGDTGSIGWRYRWDPARARQTVLRTHCTAASVRALARHPKPPRKVFCIGPVFRNETTDYKHLPVFHQVDGIVIDERGSFAALLGILSHFYTKMGFARFEFRPAFFPYTEPSVEIFVWHNRRADWVEMGGAGVFRPEVTLPTGCDVPVLAWGLGLERLAMFRLGEENISTLYQGVPGGRGGRVGWLREVPLCR